MASLGLRHRPTVPMDLSKPKGDYRLAHRQSVVKQLPQKLYWPMNTTTDCLDLLHLLRRCRMHQLLE